MSKTGSRRYRRGSAIVEFTAAMFVFVFILIAILQGAALGYTLVTLSNSAREGARAAASNPQGNWATAIDRAAKPLQVLDKSCGGGESVTCRVTLQVPVLFSYWGINTWPVWEPTTTATMRKER